MSKTVFVSGASGYIAQHIVKDLIAKGYTVIGSVRSVEKGEKLKTSLKSDKFSFVIVSDIQVKGAFDKVFESHKEISVVLHTASPFTFSITDNEKDLLIPAVEGTKNVLSAIKIHAPQVERVVVTSSYAAISTAANDYTKGVVTSESTWNDLTWEQAKEDPIKAYYGSKTFAEQAAWDFVKTEKPHFVLSIVNPVYVFGPQAFDAEVKDTLNTSAEIVNNILKVKPTEKAPQVEGGFIDVRDVSKAHIYAFEKENTKNERLILSNGRFTTQFILDIINENVPALKGKVPVGTPGTGAEIIEKMATIDNSKTKKILGWEFISLKQSVVDTIEQVLKAKK